MNVGGHAGPTIGRVGAAKGLTDVSSAPKLTAAAEAIKVSRSDRKPSPKSEIVWGKNKTGLSILFGSG
jgi:hypothetical protein